MSTKTSIFDLPTEVLLLILPHLAAQDFLSLTASCRALHETYTDEPTYWVEATRKTFRVANQPVIENDGARWRKLYKRLKTDTRAYGWGDNTHNCLSQTMSDDDTSPQAMMRRRRKRHVSWPEEMQEPDNIGVISDIQGGGWSSSILTSDGAIRISGVLDGQSFQTAQNVRQPLRYPSGFTDPSQRYDPATATKQFSHGRQHILALSDSGRIWSWKDATCAAIGVRFVHHDTIEGRRQGPGAVKKVVAGWDKSAALVEGSGLIVWAPVGRSPRQAADADIAGADIALVLESAVVPGSNVQQHESGSIGHVDNFIVLEQLIIVKTDIGKAFVSHITWGRGQYLTDLVELPTPQDDPVLDVQGTFRNLGVFLKSGAVLTTTQDRLFETLLRTSAPSPELIFTRIKALQNKQVISLAFGDYHFHALHAPGYITSYGTESDTCGALGLGGYASPEGRLRGIRHEGAQLPGVHAGFRMRGDGKLVPHAYARGRRVWFEKEKREWIKFLTSGGADPEEAAERLRMAIGTADYHAQGEISEWIEQEGTDWEDKYNARDGNDDGLPAYFVLSVTASGHHSGALVLVNQQLADRITRAVELPEPSEEVQPTAQSLLGSLLWRAYDLGRWFLGVSESVPIRANLRRNNPITFGASPRDGHRYIWADDPFPRLRLSNGTEMPGEAPLNEWRYGEPSWELDE